MVVHFYAHVHEVYTMCPQPTRGKVHASHAHEKIWQNWQHWHSFCRACKVQQKAIALALVTSSTLPLSDINAINVNNEGDMSRTKCQTSYATKKFVSNTIKGLSSDDLEWQQKMWFKVVDVLDLQVLLPKGYGSIAKASERSNIIQNLSNNLGQKLGALKCDGIHGQQLVCTMATS